MSIRPLDTSEEAWRIVNEGMRRMTPAQRVGRLVALTVMTHGVGSVASAAHGEARSTNDVDVVAELDEAGARELVARLGNGFYADADVAADAARRRSSFNIATAIDAAYLEAVANSEGLETLLTRARGDAAR